MDAPTLFRAVEELHERLASHTKVALAGGGVIRDMRIQSLLRFRFQKTARQVDEAIRRPINDSYDHVLGFRAALDRVGMIVRKSCPETICRACRLCSERIFAASTLTVHVNGLDLDSSKAILADLPNPVERFRLIPYPHKTNSNVKRKPYG